MTSQESARLRSTVVTLEVSVAGLPGWPGVSSYLDDLTSFGWAWAWSEITRQHLEHGPESQLQISAKPALALWLACKDDAKAAVWCGLHAAGLSELAWLLAARPLKNGLRDLDGIFDVELEP